MLKSQDFLVALGAEMRRRRKARDLSQQDLAEVVGCSQATISAVESGQASITETRKLARLWGISL